MASFKGNVAALNIVLNTKEKTFVPGYRLSGDKTIIRNY